MARRKLIKCSADDNMAIQSDRDRRRRVINREVKATTGFSERSGKKKSGRYLMLYHCLRQDLALNSSCIWLNLGFSLGLWGYLGGPEKSSGPISTVGTGEGRVMKVT